MLKKLYSILFIIFITITGSQSQPIGQWTVQTPYNGALDVVTTPTSIWAALEAAIMSVDKDDFSIRKFTKANGLSDVNIAALAYDSTTDALIVAYKNTNIDIIQGNTVTNLPSIKNATIIGNKTILKMHANNGIVWLACGFGIVKLNIERKEIADTYFVGVGNTNLQINDIWANENYVFAASEDGLIRGGISPFINLSNADDENAWLRYNFENNNIPDAETDLVTSLNGKIYATQGNEVFELDNATAEQWESIELFNGWLTNGWTTEGDLIYLSQNLVVNDIIQDTRIGTFDGSNFSFIEDNGQFARPANVALDANGNLWYADLFLGLVQYDNNNVSLFVPNGPYKSSLFRMTYEDGKVYVASSNLRPTLPGGDDANLPYGLYISEKQNWTNYVDFNSPVLQGSFDIAEVIPVLSENKLFIVTDGFGLIEMNLDNRDGIVQTSPPNSTRPYRSIAADKDGNNNIWFTNAFSSEMPLGCRKPNGEYVYFTDKTGGLFNKAINDIAVDDFNQLWISTIGNGVYVYNYNNTIDDPSDDELKVIGTGFGLPSEDVRCLTVDDDGEVWIGTSQGVGVVYCAGSIFNNTCPVDRICIPRDDTTNFCDNLLENEIVNCIATDPANRKWIGTNGGIFLQSSDGLETVYNFTEDNSPLLSNVIRSVVVDEQTGDVYIGTDKGINTFKAEATLTEDGVSGAPFVFPNPVRPEYEGPIAIRNLANNGNVKIMDVAGHVVFETQSTGGQAIWDGRDANGKRVQTGVYIVLSATEDGKMKKTAKFVFIN